MYYAYLRVSTETQSEHGYGLAAQREAIEAWAQREGVSIERFFVDAGISGAAADTADDSEALSKRAGLLELLSTIANGDTVIVLNTSRLWRADITKVLIRRELLKRGAQVYSIEQPRYSLYAQDPSERLISGMLELLDAWDRDTIAAKLARGRATKAHAGAKPAGACPYGYQYAADKKSVVINKAEAAAVRLMFSAAQKGESLAALAKELNQNGITPRRAASWTRGSVHAILTNTFYTGVLTHAGQELQGAHEPIISKIQFGKVQKQLEQRRK